MDGVRVPGYWPNETSGVLRPAVEAYLAGADLDEGQVAAMRAYVRQWVAGDFLGRGIDELRAAVDGITDTASLRAWMTRALDLGIDPL